MCDRHRFVVDVDHSGVGVGGLCDFVDVAGGGDAGAQVEELPARVAAPQPNTARSRGVGWCSTVPATAERAATEDDSPWAVTRQATLRD